jgi:hypothetical protein
VRWTLSSKSWTNRLSRWVPPDPSTACAVRRCDTCSCPAAAACPRWRFKLPLAATAPQLIACAAHCSFCVHGACVSVCVCVCEQEGLDDQWRGPRAAARAFRANYLEMWDKVGSV